MYLNMFIVIGFVTRRLPADVTGEGSRAAVHLHMLREVITPMERLTAFGHLTNELLRHLVFADVPLTVVLPDELAAAVVAGVGADRLVRVHVRDVLGVPNERALAEGTLEGLSGPAHVGPAMQFQVPLGRERLVADDARVGPLAAVREQVRAQVRPQVHLDTNM